MDAGASLRKPKGLGSPSCLDWDTRLTITGLPQNFKPEPPSTPEGLGYAFAADFSQRVREIRERILGEQPQLRRIPSEESTMANIY
jgi:hypothetical protein